MPISTIVVLLHLSCVLGGITLSSHHLMRWHSSRHHRTRPHPAWHSRPGSMGGTRPKLAQVLLRTFQSVALLTPRTARQRQRKARLQSQMLSPTARPLAPHHPTHHYPARPVLHLHRYQARKRVTP